PPAPPSIALGTPIPNNAAPLVPGMLTPSPALIEAGPASKGFAGISTETSFPMLFTVAQPGTFAGNASGTAAGGTIIFNNGQVGFSANFALPSGPFLNDYTVTAGTDL